MTRYSLLSLIAAVISGGVVAPAAAQTLGQCRQSFKDFDPSRTATLPISGQPASCEALEALRLQLMPTEAELRQVGDAEQQIARYRAAQFEAKEHLEREARSMAVGAMKTVGRIAATTKATYDAINECALKWRKGQVPNAQECLRRVAKANASAGKAIDTYHDEYLTNEILRNESTKLIAVLEGKIKTTDDGVESIEAKAAAFLATCALVVKDCVVPPLPVPRLN